MKRLEEAICRALRKAGYRAYRICAHPSPDIVAFRRGKILLIEVKSRQVRVERQERFLKKLCREFKRIGVRCIPCYAWKIDTTVVLVDMENMEKILEFEISED